MRNMAIWRAALCGITLLLAGAAATAQQNNADQPPAQPPVNSWTINCASAGDVNALDCLMSQSLTEAKTGQRVLTITIRRQPDTKYALVLMLPHGIYLPAGVSYSIDGKEKAAATIQTADQNGSYAVVPMEVALVKALKAGTRLDVGVETAQRQPLVLPISLTGFSATYDKLVAMN